MLDVASFDLQLSSASDAALNRGRDRSGDATSISRLVIARFVWLRIGVVVIA